MQQREQCTGPNWEQGPKGAAVQMHRDYSFLPRDDIWFHIPRSSLTLSMFFCPFNKCHCTSSSISVSARHGDRYGQMPRAQQVTHVTEHLTSSGHTAFSSLLSAKTSALYQAPCGWVRLVAPQLLPRTQLLSNFPTAFPNFYQPVQAHLEDLSPLCR